MELVGNQTIFLGFSKSRSLFKIGSQLIRFYEGTNFSHAYIKYMDPSTGIMLVAQASHGFVNEMNSDVFISENIIISEYSVNIAEEELHQCLIFIKTNLGKKYSKLQLLAIVLRDLFGHLPFGLNRDNEFICSEFVSRIASILNIFPKNIDFDFITPKQLFDYLYEYSYQLNERIKKLS